MLKQRCSEFTERMIKAVDAFPWEQKAAYANYLAQTYFYTSHSERLLGLALSRTGSNDTELFSYFTDHINEEHNHEKLALADLQRLGYDIDDFKELPGCRMLWEPQYYKIEHIGAAVLLGYIVTLESLAAERASEIATRVGNISPGNSSNRFMKVHGQDDIWHVKTAFSRISAIEDTWSEAILENMEQTSSAYINMLEEILATTAEP